MVKKPQQIRANEWLSDTLPSLLDEYDEENIFNVDETALFYKALPNGTYTYASEKPEGRKEQKERLTVVLLCNMAGTYKEVFVIGKVKKSRCFQEKKIPLPYFFNKKGWMIGSLWTKILLDLDKRMLEMDRKIILFAGNAPCHVLAEDTVLQNLKIYFLPVNTTTIGQLLDQGIIKAFKSGYRKKIILE